MPDEILRTFIAIELDERLLAALQRIQGKYKQSLPRGSVRWVAPEGIHLTLKFLGDTPRDRVPKIAAALQTTCAGFAPFEFSVEGQGCFPNFRRPRVIWVAVREQGRILARLQAAIEQYVAPLGWPSEKRPFSPHLTLGRVSRHATSRERSAVGQVVEQSAVEQIGRQRVNAVSLIRSELRSTGAVYTELFSAPLGGAVVAR